MPKNIHPNCLKKPSSLHIFIERTHKSVKEIITKYRRKWDVDSHPELTKSKCRDCGNLIGRSNFDNMFKKQRFAVVGCEEIFVIVFLIILLVVFGLGLFLIRRFNHGFLYGTGGCQPTFLWTSRNCQIMA